MGSGQEWWSHKERELEAEKQARWNAFVQAHQLEAIHGDLNALRAEFLAAERVRERLEEGAVMEHNEFFKELVYTGIK